MQGRARALRRIVGSLRAPLLALMLCALGAGGAFAESPAPTAAGSATAAGPGVAPQALPFTLRPGDVVANAPVGVLRNVLRSIMRASYSPAIGVMRRLPAPSPITRTIHSATLSVLRGSAVAAVAPGAVGVGEAGQRIVLSGYGLAQATAVRIEPAAGITVVSLIAQANGSEVELVLDVAADASAGMRQIRLLRASGTVIPAIDAAAQQLLVADALPIIESVTPSLAGRGEAHTLTIRGRNLRGLPIVAPSFVDPEQPVVRLVPAEGVAVAGTPVSNNAGTLVTVEIRIAADAPLGDRRVQVETRSGVSSSLLTPSNTLRVAESPILTRSPFASPLLGVLRQRSVSVERLAFSRAVGVVRGAAILTMTPAAVELGSAATLVLAGRGLTTATEVRIAPSDGITIVPGSFVASADEVRVELSVAANASLFSRRVDVALAGRVLSAPRLLEVRDAVPVVNALTPTWLLRDGLNQTIEIQGVALSQTTAARLLPDQGVIIEDYEALDANRARLVLRAAPAASSGPRVVQVSSPSATSSADSTPGNTLFIRDRADVRTPFVSPALGVMRNPPAGARARLAWSAQLGVMRGPYAHALQPRLWRRGISTHVSVSGRGLSGVTAVDLPGSDGVSIAGLSVAADGLSLEFDAAVTADATPGLRRVRLATAAGEIGFAPLDAGLAEVDDNTSNGPVGEPDTYSGDANGEIDIAAAAGVLANDFNPGGGALSAVLRRLPASGNLDFRADGSFLYRPNPDFAGTDRFEYSPGNATTLGAATVVTLDINERNDARDDNYSARDNEALTVPASAGLLANDVITAGDVPQIVLDSQPTLGQLQLSPDGAFVYTPQRQSGTDLFSYRLVAGDVRSRPAQVRIVIEDVNEAPVPADDAYVSDRGAALQVAANRGVLVNDTDPDGDVLQARVLTNPAVGSLSLNTDGSFVFTPPQNFVGETSFRYEAMDPRGLRAAATVRITVNDTLAAQDDSYAMNEGEILFVDENAGLLANDSVFPQGTLRIVLDAQPTRGNLQLADDGSFVYTLSSTDFSGVDSFRYRLRDNVVTSPPAQVTIQIRAVNDPPVATEDRYLTDENADLTVAAPGVLGNDTDVDSGALAAQLVAPPQHGAVTLGADGRFSYVPEVNYRGTDTFEYVANDGASSSSPTRVSIQVTQPPTATNDVYLVDIDTPLEIIDPLQGLLVNDHDAPERDRLFALLDQPPANGTLTLNENGTFRYVPTSGFQGLDIWTYQVTDTRSESNVGTVTMAVGITSLPRAVPDAYETSEDAELVVPAVTGLLANDLDSDTPAAQLEAYLVGYAEGVSVTVNLDGSFRLRPPANFFGDTFFVYQIYDGTDISNSAIVSVRVNPVNDGVEARDDQFGVLRNTVFDSLATSYGGVRYNDTYDPDFPVNFEVVQAPQFGSAQLDPLTGRLRYTPQQDFAGTDQLTYRLFQVSTGVSDTAVVRLRVNAPPITGPDAYSVTEDTLTDVTPGLLANDSDVDGDAVALTGTSFIAGASGVYVATVSVDNRNAPTRTTVHAYAHFYGTVDLSYRITDGTQDAVGSIRLQVAAVPDDPQATANQYLTQRNTPLSVSSPTQGVLNNDFDPDARPHAGGSAWAAAAGVDLQPLRAELVDNVAHGTLTLADTGTFYYVPNTDYSGYDQFRYRVRDGTNRASAAVQVTIRINSPPQASDDAYVASEDTVLVVPAAEGVLVNDSDIDGDPISAAGGSCSPCHGRVQLAADGSFRYTPYRDYYGQDEFFYSVRDGVAAGDTGRVSITVLPVNDPPLTDSDTYRTREDEVLVAPEPQGVLRNDREVDGDQLVRSEMTVTAQHGSVAYQSDGSFTYTPNVNYNGSDRFRYRVYDSTGLSTEESVDVQITAVNDAPDATDDSYATPLNAELLVAAADGVLRNDGDVDGPRLSVSLIGSPQHGQLDLSPDGGFRYRPDGFFTGIERFQYQLDDGLGALDVGNVLLEVRPVTPVVEVFAENDFYRFPGPQLSIAAPGVLANDAIEGPGTLSARVVIPPDVGVVQMSTDGSFTFTAPDGYAGVAGFSYAAEAGGSSAVARVTLDVQSVANVPPQARGESYGLLEDAMLDSRQIASLLSNDSDHEGAALVLDLMQAPAHGTVQWLGHGHFLYRPAAQFNGFDRIGYRVFDGIAYSSQVWAELTVFAQNDAPVANDDVYRVEQRVRLDVPTATGVLRNDVDIDGDALMVELVDAPRKGQLRMDPEGGFSYVPLPDAIGEDSFRYAASDLLALSTATVHLNIARENRPPTATGERFEIDEDQLADSAQLGLLTANDIDPDGDALNVRLVEPPALGQLELDGGGFRYRPDANRFGLDRFSYTVSDGAFETAPVWAEIAIRSVNDAPVAEADMYATRQGVPLQIAAAQGVLANDRDVENDPLTLALVDGPSHGQLQLGSTGGFSYTPVAEFAGRDEFAYRISDATANAIGRVAIDVTRAANTRPRAVGERFTIAEDTALDTRALQSLLANDSDVDGQPLSVVSVEEPALGTVEWFAGGHLRYLPARDQATSVAIRYAVSDGELQSESVSATIEFVAQNDAPQPVSDVYTLAPGSTTFEVAAGIGVLANDRDPDGDALIVSVITPPLGGTLNLALDGGFTFVPVSPMPAQEQFRYRVADAAGLSAEASVLLLMDSQGAPTRIFNDSFESR